jgi:hypothetical protein
LKKYLRHILKGIAFFIGLLLILYTAAYIYVAANKKYIIKQVSDQVADKLNGEIKLGDIDLSFIATFPSMAVVLKDVSIRDTLFNTHKHPFFEAKKVYATISIVKIIQRNNPLSGVRVENGKLYIYTDSLGYTNSYLLTPKSKVGRTEEPAKSKTQINDVRFKNVRLVLDDRQKNKLLDFDVIKINCDISNKDSTARIKVKNNILIHNLAFNTTRGSFVKETPFEGNIELFYNKSLKQLSFNDIEIRLKDHPFHLTGRFDFSGVPSFSFKVVTDRIDYAFARSLLTEKMSTALAIVKLDKPVENVTAVISGPLKGEPLVKATWTLNDNSLQSPFANFTDCSLAGSYINEIVQGQPRNDDNSRLELTDFSGKWEGLDVVSKKILIDNLRIPTIKCDIKTDFALEQLNNVLESNTFELNGGRGVVDITYNGPLAKNNNRNTLINGKISLKNGVMTYLPRNMPINNVSTDIVFKNTDVFVNDFRGTVKGSKIIMNGSGKNLLSLLATNAGKIFVDWNIYSPSLNLGNFTSLLQKRTSVVRKRAAGRPKLGNTAQNLDEIVNQANFRLDLKADELIYSKFRASNVKASLGLINENWTIHNISLQHAGGSMVINGQLNEKNNRFYQANVKANVHNVDVAKIMYAFNDFGQDGIESKNLTGKLSSNVQMTMDIDRNLAGTPENMFGFVDFSLKNGALINYAPLKKIQDVAFKKRNFDEIQFAELKDRLEVKNKEIKINRMEIQSTVLTLFVEGLYSIKGNNTDISIQVPLSNIKSRDKDYVPENKGVDSKGGASIYVRGRPGDDGSIQFKLDLFRKFRKSDTSDDKKEEEKKDQKSDDKKEEKKVNEETKEEKKVDKTTTEDKKKTGN